MREIKWIGWITFITALSVSPRAFAQRTIIHCGRLIDGVANAARTQVSILIQGDKIIGIEKGFLPKAEDDVVINYQDKTVLPGLIDLHTHLSGQLSPQRYLERFTLNPEEEAYRSVLYAERTLMAGFTTVRELGGTISIALRNAIQQGYVKGPRIFAAGKAIATTGGHADPSNGAKRELMKNTGPEDGVVNGIDDARKAVRQRYKEGADLIKITATGGVLSVAKSGHNPQFTEEEIRAIVQTARDYGMHVAAHAHGAEGMKRAIRAGVRTIEHGTLMDDEVIELMKREGTYFVPTISAGVSVAEKSKLEGYLPDLVRPKAAELGPLTHATFTKAWKAGIKIAFGTDAGVYDHGQNAKEFQYMVDAGMPPMAALQSATRVAAEVLEISDRVGTIQAGKLADLIAVDGNPLEDITAMQRVTFVMKEGKTYKR